MLTPRKGLPLPLRLIPWIFLVLCIEHTLPQGVNWHRFQSINPTVIIVILAFFYALPMAKYQMRRGRMCRISLRLCNFTIFVCVVFFILLYIEGKYNVLPGYLGPRILVPFVKIWPYLQLPLWVVVGIVLARFKEELRMDRFVILGLTILLSVYVLDAFLLFKGNHLIRLHNAFIGSVAHILMAVALVRLLRSENPVRKTWLGLVMLALFILPFYAALRGASLTGVIILGSILLAWSRRLALFTSIIPTILVLIIAWSIASEDIKLSFTSLNPYGYESPIDVIRHGISAEEVTARSRLSWWEEALNYTAENPITGARMGYTFQRRTGAQIFSTRGVHNYFVAMLTDGGLVLFLPMVALIFLIMGRGFGLVRRGNLELLIALAWLLAVIMEHLTNTWAFAPLESIISSIVFGYAAGTILVFGNLKTDKKDGDLRVNGEEKV